MPDVSQETLYPDVLQPRGGALQCSSPQCNLIILISLVILVTSRQSHRPHHAASHRVTPVTASHANRSESDPLTRALGLEAGGR